jgi:CDP-glycerol glycerophosphotransferase
MFKNLVGSIINLVAKLFRIKKNKILFQSGRNKVDCNPYAIYKYIKENCPNDFECVWLVERETDVSMLEDGDYFYYRTFKGIVAMATSKYWIRSQSLGGIIKKKKNQVYIQMWHGAGNLKKCGYDCLDECNRPTETVHHAVEWDYLIATDKYNEEVMVGSVGFKKKSIVLGNADSDLIVNADSKYIDSIKEKIGLKNNKKKVIMYAPTFRDTDLDKDSSDLNIPIMELKNLDDYIILLRLHPLISKKIEGVNLPNNFINVGWYPNILDLYLITDILITDYSSIIFPYMILEKGLILYPYDYDDYVKLRGGFYLDYKNDLPGPIVYNEKDLVNTIDNLDNIMNKYRGKVKKFNKKYNSLNDGHVSERFVNKLKNGEFK